MNKNLDISIIIPVYNEENSIQSLCSEIINNLNKDFTWEIIFINDGSTDNSRKNILKLIEQYSNIKLIDAFKNMGKSESLNEGFKYCSGNIVITLDADLQDDPSEINNFIELILSGNDMVSGWKKNRKDPLSKVIPSKIFNFVLRFFSSIKLNDFNCGFKAYKIQVVKSLVLYGGLHRFIPILVKQNGFTIEELVVNHRIRKYGKSKYGKSRIFHGFFDLVTVLFLNKYFTKPLHFFGLFGFLLTLVGMVINIYLTFLWFNGIPIGNRPLLFFGILNIIVGFQLVSIGLIGELIVRYYKKQKNSSYRFYNIIE